MLLCELWVTGGHEEGSKTNSQQAEGVYGVWEQSAIIPLPSVALSADSWRAELVTAITKLTVMEEDACNISCLQ